MVHICISRVHWVDYFTVPGKCMYGYNAEKTVLLEHTKANFNPIAESGQFWTVRSGWVEGRVDYIL